MAKPNATGIGLDPSGGPLIDPTQNVKDLMEASVKALTDRQDLLAQLADEKISRMELAIEHRQDVEKLTAVFNTNLHEARSYTAEVRESHSRELRESEAKRLDAIRATDVAAVSTTAAQSLAAIQELARTQAQSAEVLRNQVSTTATTIANQTDRIVSPIMERLAALEKIVNIGQGRSTVADPQISELMAEMRKLSSSRDVVQGKSEGLSLSAAILMAAVTVLFGLVGVGATLYAVLKP